MDNDILRAQAIQIRIGIHNLNRNHIDAIDRKYGLPRLTRVLRHYKLITAAERRKALALRTYINNPSCKALATR